MLELVIATELGPPGQGFVWFLYIVVASWTVLVTLICWLERIRLTKGEVAMSIFKTDYIKVTLADGTVYPLLPGDTVDLGEDGIVVFFGGSDADIARQLREAGRERVKGALEWIRKNGADPSITTGAE